MSRAAVLAAFAALAFAPAGAWSKSALDGAQAQAAIEGLNGRLLASRSATTTLEAWCAQHRMAQPPRLRAERVLGADKPITDKQRTELQVGPREPIRYRRVRLACGAHVLSQADNWYVPSRLTPEMNRLLQMTDSPFGRVVAPLHPTRRTLVVERLWSPPPGGSRRNAALPPDLFSHRAILYDAQGHPIAEVVETYSAQVLDYGR